MTRTFTPDNLQRLVMQASQAPDGTTYRGPDSGSVTVDDLTETDREAAQFRKDGFEAAWSSVYVNQLLFDSQGQKPPPDGKVAANQMAVFKTAAGAADALTVTERRVSVLKNVTYFDASIMGPGAAGFKGILPHTPTISVYVMWREGNVIGLLDLGEPDGKVTPQDCLKLARQIAQNAFGRL